MSSSFYAAVLLLLAITLANVPFLTERGFGFMMLAQKSLGLRLLELCLLYLLVGFVGVLFEAHIGSVHAQSWQFYAITLTLFMTFAFPGFVYRYLVKRS